MIAFGPVPSRRLGRSLGVNNIPDKFCSYSCIYCQLGKTIKLDIVRREFYNPQYIFNEVYKKVKEVESKGDKIDYITFVPDGEPTLDVNLGREIELIKSLGYKIALLTNGSLLFREDVVHDLIELDLISLKVDAYSNTLWRIVNRPHPDLNYKAILDSMIEFSRIFKRRLITETMLISNVSYSDEELYNIASFISKLNPYKAYIAIPTRPPACGWVKPADENTINRAFQIFSSILGMNRVEYLIGYEGTEFSASGDIVKDILSITSVHPMREDAIAKLLDKDNASWDIIEDLIKKGLLIRLEYAGHTYYMRKIKSRM